MISEYENSSNDDIVRENAILADYDFSVSPVPPEGPAPALDELSPIDLEGLSTRTVRGFNLTTDMTKFL